MFLDTENIVDRVLEISSRLTEDQRLIINLAFLVDEILADCYRSAISQIVESENAEDACEHARAFTRSLEKRNFSHRLVTDVSNALRWYIGYYYRCNRWENSEYVGDKYRRRVLRVSALAQRDGDQGEKIEHVYNECWRRWAIEPDELDWDADHSETSPRCVRRL